MSNKLTELTEVFIFSDNDEFYIVTDPGGSPLSRRISSLTLQRHVHFAQSAISGLTLSNGTDANNDINIAAGRAGAVSEDYNLYLTSALTKQLDAIWAVGTNQGGLDTGTKAVSTWYHLWLIGRTDTNVVDVLFSTSATAPTMPANYTEKRRIGAVRTDSSGNLIPFLQYGDDFWWKSPPFLDVDDATLTTAKKNYTLAGVPGGLVVEVFANLRASQSGGAVIYFSNPNFTDLAPSASATPLAAILAPSGGAHSQLKLLTDTSAQISARSTASSTTVRITVLGWKDPRGRW